MLSQLQKTPHVLHACRTTFQMRSRLSCMQYALQSQSAFQFQTLNRRCQPRFLSLPVNFRMPLAVSPWHLRSFATVANSMTIE